MHNKLFTLRLKPKNQIFKKKQYKINTLSIKFD